MYYIRCVHLCDLLLLSQTRTDENLTHLPRGKGFQRMEIKPRTALGTIGGNSVLDRQPPAGKVSLDVCTCRPPRLRYYDVYVRVVSLAIELYVLGIAALFEKFV